MFPQTHTQNAYLVAVLKTLEAEFLDQNDFERMIEARSPQEALQVLGETVYAQYFGDIKSPQDFDVVLNESLEEVKKTILKHFSPEKHLRILWLKYDFLNVKSLVKAKLGQISPLDIKLNNLGQIDSQIFKEVILEGSDKKLPYGLKEIIRAVEKDYEKKKDPQEIDFILDKKYLEVFTRELSKIKSKSLNDFLRQEIDLFNLKTYFRFPEAERKEAAFIPGGLIPLPRFQIENKDQFIKSIVDSEEQSWILELKERIEKDGLIALEKEMREILLDILERARQKILGIEPVFAFWRLKVEETKLIHKILTLKNAGIAPAEIHRTIGF